MQIEHDLTQKQKRLPSVAHALPSKQYVANIKTLCKATDHWSFLIYSPNVILAEDTHQGMYLQSYVSWYNKRFCMHQKICVKKISTWHPAVEGSLET